MAKCLKRLDELHKLSARTFLVEYLQHPFIMKLTLFTLASVAALAVAAPASQAPETLEKRADYCGQWDNQIIGDFTVYNVCSTPRASIIEVLTMNRTSGARLMPLLDRNAPASMVTTTAPSNGTRSGHGQVVLAKSNLTPTSSPRSHQRLFQRSSHFLHPGHGRTPVPT
jgi:hypothetical protein